MSIAAGYAALRGVTWARMTGIGLASLSMIVQFMFIPHYPIWSVLVIALDAVVVYALATYRRDPAWPHHLELHPEAPPPPSGYISLA